MTRPSLSLCFLSISPSLHLYLYLDLDLDLDLETCVCLSREIERLCTRIFAPGGATIFLRKGEERERADAREEKSAGLFFSLPEMARVEISIFFLQEGFAPVAAKQRHRANKHEAAVSTAAAAAQADTHNRDPLTAAEKQRLQRPVDELAKSPERQRPL